MVDSGAGSTIMPKLVAEKIDHKYEPSTKGVLQLDGSSNKTIGIINDMKLAFHACPSVTISRDVMVLNLLPYFSICLFRDFTSNIGGYLSVDWKYLVFRTRYGANVTINLDPLSNFHVEAFTPSSLNENYTLSEKHLSYSEAETGYALEGVPDLFKDKKTDEDHEYDPWKIIEEKILRIYCIHLDNVEILTIKI